MPYSEVDRLSNEALRQSLDGIFSFDVSSGRNYEELIEALASLSRSEQDFSLHWAMVAAQTHLEIAYLVVLLMPDALRRLGAKPADVNRIHGQIIEGLWQPQPAHTSGG